MRDNHGRWQAGHSGNPAGRAPRKQEEEMLDAIKTTFPPERITSYLEQAMEIAIKNGSARSIIAVLEFAAHYSLGKPIARTERVGGNAIEEAMQRWKEMQAQSEQAEIEQMF